MDTVSAYCIIAWRYGGMRAQENVDAIHYRRLSMEKEKLSNIIFLYM